MSRSISPPNTGGSLLFAQRATPTRHRHSNSTHPTQTSDETSQHSSLAPNPFEDPFVKKLYADVQDGHKALQDVTKELVLNQRELYDVQKSMFKLMEENQKLKLENQILQAEVARFSLSASTSRAQSLSPSDSISQVPTPSHISFAPSVAVRPSKRPSEYPFEVLWTVDDCRNDPDASPPNSNPSRPPMNLAIRTSDGALISAEKYNNIRTDISLLPNANLHQLPTPINDPTRHRKSICIADGIEMRSISWYKSCYPHIVTKVLQQLEIMHNELQLCSGHWKAEHMLMQHLNSCNSTARGWKSTVGKGKGRARQPSISNSDAPQSAPPPTSDAGSLPMHRLTIIPPSSCHETTDSTPSGPDINPKSSITNKRAHSDSMSATASATKRLRLEDMDETDIYLEDLNLLQDTFGLTLAPSSVRPSPSQPPSQLQPPPQPQPLPQSQPPPQNTQNMPQTLQETPINIAFISVSPSLTNLNDIFLQEFPSMKAAPLLIDRLTKIATTEKNPREPSSEVTTFISRIEDADPNSPEFTEDDTNAGWGHRQFTAGSLTISTVLTSWDAIGSVSTACKLISATIKTCRVARYMCNKRGINSESYMSDAYLDRIVDKLTDLTANHSSETRVTAQPEASTSAPNPQPNITIPAENLKYKALQAIHMDDLKAWARDNKIKVLQQNPKKADFINTILASMHVPSDDEIRLIVNKRKGKKGVTLS